MLEQITPEKTFSWILSKRAIGHIKIGQQCKLPIYIKFRSAIDRNKEEDTEIITVNDLPDNNISRCMLLEIFREDIEEDFIIQLKKTQSRILRLGVELVIEEDGDMRWQFASEKAKGEVIKNLDPAIFEI